jgi:hypothetical protein
MNGNLPCAEYTNRPSKPKDSDPFFRIFYGGKWGFISREGQLMVPPQFAAAGYFFQGIARVTLKSHGEQKVGFIDTHGKILIKPEFENAGDFREGLAPAQIGRKWGFINREGRFLIAPQFQGAGEFHEGLAVVQYWTRAPKNGPHFYTNENAPLYYFRLIKDNLWLETINSPDVFIDRYDSRIGFIDKDGKWVIQPQELDLADDFSDGRAEIRKDGKRNFLTREGNLLCSEWFRWALPFSEGLAPVPIKDKWGYIDESGHFAIPPRYEFANIFSEGLAVASIKVKDGKEPSVRMGAIDKNGKWVIKPSFTQLSNFSEGVAVANYGKENFFIDRSGQRLNITTLPVSWTGFEDGLAVVGESGEQVYINHKGRIIAPYEK